MRLSIQLCVQIHFINLLIFDKNGIILRILLTKRLIYTIYTTLIIIITLTSKAFALENITPELRESMPMSTSE